jgi:hypothetical protein
MYDYQCSHLYLHQVPTESFRTAEESLRKIAFFKYSLIIQE